MTKKEYQEKVEDIKKKSVELQIELERVIQDYGMELLEKNGYKIGDKVKLPKDGTEAFIAGYDKLGDSFYLKCNKIKKDGTPSQISAGYISIRLKEE